MAAVMVGGFALLSDFVFYETAMDSGTPIPGLRLIAIPVVILGGIGWLFSKVVAIALSRQREYLADAASVEFTRNPQALIRALEHIARIESPLRRALRGVAPLFIVDPFECAGPARQSISTRWCGSKRRPTKPKSSVTPKLSISW